MVKATPAIRSRACVLWCIHQGLLTGCLTETCPNFNFPQMDRDEQGGGPGGGRAGVLGRYNGQFGAGSRQGGSNSRPDNHSTARAGLAMKGAPNLIRTPGSVVAISRSRADSPGTRGPPR
jgi:hypothetical protein